MTEIDRGDKPAVRFETGASWRRWVVPVSSLIALVIAGLIVRGELRTTSYREIMSTVRAVPLSSILRALAATVACYLVMPLYDQLGLRYAGKSIPRSKALLASFLAYAFSQSLGFAAITGGAVRLRVWTANGLTTGDVARAAAFSAIGFWVGLLSMCGLALTFVSLPPQVLRFAPGLVLRVSGILLLSLVVSYMLMASFSRKPLKIAGLRFRPPGWKLTVAQLVVGLTDWVLAGLVAWVLVPPADSLSFLGFLGQFSLAQGIGLLSHVPGGLGVFDSIMVLLLAPHIGARSAIASLVSYRAIYYLLPFVVATLTLAVLVVRGRRGVIVGAAKASAQFAGRWGPTVLPTVLSTATFVSGLVLLLSGATPAESGRIAALDRLLPLGIIELSHLTGSLLGAALVVLAWAIRRRLDAAWLLTVIALVAGIATSLLKGLDYEEALVLLAVLAMLVPSRGAFHRRAALFAEPLEPEWIVAIVAAIGASVAFGFFAYRHVEYNNELWWRFSRTADAPRFLRATFVVLGAVALTAMWRLLRHAPAEPDLPDARALGRAEKVIAITGDTRANLALLGDKSLLLDENDRGMLMYGVEGRSWVSLGDPFGDDAAAEELAWRFREMADRHGGWTVFYEVGTERLPLYIDLGLSLLKLGEEAIVPLSDFSLDGANRKGLRRAHRDAQKRGVIFEIVNVGEVPARLPELRRISDGWLEEKETREKGFSLGRFDERYLEHNPVAVVSVGGQAVAFANLWGSANREELSVDLMRWLPSAPPGMMDFLFIELMLWARSQRYGRFNMGMAPLAGLENRTLAPLWSRAGALVFRYGEHFYNFRGLRQYKSKFDPLWEPRYLASPGGIALPRILANVATLISGGIGGIVGK